jgi:hypothetical protein
LLAGPQRLEAGWLEGAAALRDYYIARSPTAGLVWIYCERLGHAPNEQSAVAVSGQNQVSAPSAPISTWFLHGLFA